MRQFGYTSLKQSFKFNFSEQRRVALIVCGVSGALHILHIILLGISEDTVYFLLRVMELTDQNQRHLEQTKSNFTSLDN